MDDKTIAIAAGILLLVIAALYFSQPVPPTAEQVGVETALGETEYLAEPALVLSYGAAGTKAGISINNPSDETVSFNLYTVNPESSAVEEETDTPPIPLEEQVTETATRESVTLAPNQTQEKTIEYADEGSAPIYLVTKPGAAAAQAVAFDGLLRDIASLDLSEDEAAALQGKLNEALAPEEELSAEIVEDAREFVGAVRTAKIINPDYDVANEIEALELVKSIPTPTPFANPLDDLPDEIELKVSELEPSANSELSFTYALDEEPLTRFTGGVAEYASVEFEKLGETYYGVVRVDLEDAPTDSDGLFKEDAYDGKLTIGLKTLVLEKEIIVKVTIEHSRVADLEKSEELEAELEEAEQPEEIPSAGLITDSLTGKKIFVDIGHHAVLPDAQACDFGAACTNGIEEYSRNKAVGEKLADWLKSAGAEVYLFDANCEKDLTVTDRANKARDWDADLMVSIHHDSCDEGIGMVYYPIQATAGVLGESKRVAATVNARLAPLVEDNRGLFPDSESYLNKLGVLYSGAPSILVEVTRIDDPAYEQADFAGTAAKAIFDGIAEYYGYSRINSGAYRASFGCSQSVTETPAAFAGCTKYETELEAAMYRNGLYSRGFDLGLVEALIMTESSCVHEQDNNQGLMQVVTCGNEGGCEVEENIDRGTEKLATDLDNVQADLPGTSKTEQFQMVLFGYNRGMGTAELAIQKINGGMLFEDAMLEACRAYYSGGSDCSNYDQNACCGRPGTHYGVPDTGEGLGARYPERVLEFYKQACVDAGGSWLG
ncbi:MAG: N-acetylmuramoyl-L-alanine amidase [Candidatus Micrarchaeia archaeon]